MKKLISYALVFIMLFVFASCSSDTDPQGTTEAVETTVSRTASQWIDYIASEVPFDDEMTMVGAEQAKAVYGIFEEDGYSGDCALYISTMATPEEIAVFKADDALTLDDIRVKAEERIQKQIASYSDYAPQEVPKLESAVIKTVGDTIIVAVTADNSLASQIIK